MRIPVAILKRWRSRPFGLSSRQRPTSMSGLTVSGVVVRSALSPKFPSILEERP